VNSSKRIGKIIFQMELNFECCGTECCEVNELFEVSCSIRIGKIILEILDIECFRTECA